MKILEINVDGFVDLRDLTPTNALATRMEFLDNGIHFPYLHEIGVTNRSEWSVLLSRVGIDLRTKDGWLKFVFKPGYVFDKASVPALFRSIVDDDAPYIVIGAMIHDYAYTLSDPKKISFHDANKILHDVAILSGCPRVKAWIYYAAVSTPVGRILYNGLLSKRAKHQLPFVEFTKTE